MLTTIYYQNIYTNRYINENKNSSYVKAKSTLAYSQNKTNTADYFLNKASNKNNRSYITELSNSLNNVRTSCYKIEQKIGDELAYRELPKDLESFSDTYNDFMTFLKDNQKGGKKIDNVLDKIVECVHKNKDVLGSIGIKLTEDNFMSVDEENGINGNNIDYDMQEFVKTLHDNIHEFMKAPMSDYMNPKDLSSCFTYACGYDKSGSLILIEQGILVDILL